VLINLSAVEKKRNVAIIFLPVTACLLAFITGMFLVLIWWKRIGTTRATSLLLELLIMVHNRMLVY